MKIFPLLANVVDGMYHHKSYPRIQVLGEPWYTLIMCARAITFIWKLFCNSQVTAIVHMACAHIWQCIVKIWGQNKVLRNLFSKDYTASMK